MVCSKSWKKDIGILAIDSRCVFEMFQASIAFSKPYREKIYCLTFLLQLSAVVVSHYCTEKLLVLTKMAVVLYTCEQIPPGSVVNFPRVLARKKDGDLEIGQPFLEDVTVEAEILEELRGPKLVIAKFKRKKHYKRRMGHRQELTRFRITSIS